MSGTVTRSGPARSFVERMVAAARLDPGLYNEVERDASALGQATAVVIIASVCSALGGVGSAGGMLGGLLASLAGWLFWAAVTWIVGDKLLGGTATWGELLRTLGFAQAPGVLYITAALPLLGWIARAIVMVWVLCAGIVALREALDFGTGKAILTALIGWLFLVLFNVLFAAPPALGF
jgi:hypothetical protein